MQTNLSEARREMGNAQFIGEFDSPEAVGPDVGSLVERHTAVLIHNSELPFSPDSVSNRRGAVEGANGLTYGTIKFHYGATPPTRFWHYDGRSFSLHFNGEERSRSTCFTTNEKMRSAVDHTLNDLGVGGGALSPEAIDLIPRMIKGYRLDDDEIAQVDSALLDYIRHEFGSDRFPLAQHLVARCAPSFPETSKVFAFVRALDQRLDEHSYRHVWKPGDRMILGINTPHKEGPGDGALIRYWIQ